MGMRTTYTDKEILADIQRCINKYGNKVTVAQYGTDKDSVVSVPTIYNRFGTWNKAKATLNVPASDLREGGFTGTYSDKYLINELKKCAKRRGCTPTLARFEADPKTTVSAQTIRTRWGTWSKAIAAAGLEPAPWKYNDDEILKQIKDVAKDLKRTPTHNEFGTHRLSGVSSELVATRFGTWQDGLRAAGLMPLTKRTAQEITSNVDKYIKKINRTPRVKNYQVKQGAPECAGTVYKRAGKWSEVVRANGHIPRGARTKDELSRLLKGHMDVIGQNPTTKSIMADKNLPHPITFTNRFGSLAKAIKAAKKIA